MIKRDDALETARMIPCTGTLCDRDRRINATKGKVGNLSHDTYGSVPLQQQQSVYDYVSVLASLNKAATAVNYLSLYQHVLLPSILNPSFEFIYRGSHRSLALLLLENEQTWFYLVSRAKKCAKA